MSSTRNRNIPGNYKLEKKANNDQLIYFTNTMYAISEPSYFPGNGLGVAKIARDELSSNWCDIETQLFGIGANNLENPTPEVVPQYKQMKSLNIFEKTKLYLPEPMKINLSERPMFLN